MASASYDQWQVLNSNYGLKNGLWSQRLTSVNNNWRDSRTIMLMYLFSALDLENVSNAKPDHKKWVWSLSVVSDIVLTVSHSQDLGFMGNQWNLMLTMFFIPWCCMTYRGTCLSKGFGLATSPVSPAGDVACCHLHDRISANGILRDARLTLEVNQALWLVWSTLSLKILHLSLCLSFARFCELLTICDKEIVIQFEMLQPWSDWDKKVGDCISIASLKGTLSISL